VRPIRSLERGAGQFEEQKERNRVVHKIITKCSP
jgi:hypothetical protein